MHAPTLLHRHSDDQVEFAPVAAAPPPRVRRWRWARRLLAAVLALVLLTVIAGVVMWNVTPGVGDAQARSSAILRAHGGTSDGGSPPARVSSALVATEDSRFYSHHGLDPESIVRGLLSFVSGGQLGGATLDAQLAKLLYEGGQSGAWSTSQEAILALKLDHSYSKRQILAMYLDAAYFGHGSYGIEAASRSYFGLSPDQLSWGQASLLAGLVNAPTAYDPTAHLHLARERQSHVLDRLVATNVLTRSQADAVYAQPLNPAVAFSG
jgi:penicillin-binding protein 1A